MTKPKTLMTNASKAEDVDTAQVFADVLNNDLSAIEKFTNRRKFSMTDAMRISRVLSEYEELSQEGMVQALKSLERTGTPEQPPRQAPALDSRSQLVRPAMPKVDNSPLDASKEFAA